MEQKVIQIGNSVGIILPQVIRQDMNVNVGDKVILKKKGNDIVISTPKKALAPDVDVKFAAMVDDFLVEHDDVLRKLAKR